MRSGLAVCGVLLIGIAAGFLGRGLLIPDYPTVRVAKGPAAAMIPATQRTQQGRAEADAAPASGSQTAETNAETTEADPGSPREAVAGCVTCHGLDGIAKIPIAPHLAGESRVYIETQLKAFRTGKREHEMMTVIAEGMSDAAIKAAAKWYAAIKITAEVPE